VRAAGGTRQEHCSGRRQQQENGRPQILRSTVGRHKEAAEVREEVVAERAREAMEGGQAGGGAERGAG
jgi:hypothetical protein